MVRSWASPASTKLGDYIQTSIKILWSVLVQSDCNSIIQCSIRKWSTWKSMKSDQNEKFHSSSVEALIVIKTRMREKQWWLSYEWMENKKNGQQQRQTNIEFE